MCSAQWGCGWIQSEPVSLSESESALRECLRSVRLVGELDLSPGNRIYQMARIVVEEATRFGDYSRLNRYPAATVVFLVAEGARRYDAGRFWPNIDVLATTSAPDQAVIGQAFLSAISRLGLDNFEGAGESERWLRYVTPILIHGGIPAGCAHEVAALVLDCVQDGFHDAVELIEGVLRSPTRRAQIAKPLRRFFDYGGEFAIDLVQRMLTVVEDATEFGADAAGLVSEIADDAGLPRYLVQALIDRDPPSPPSRQSRPPRPYVRIDRYSSDGPYLVIPAVPGAATSEWLVRGPTPTRLKSSRHRAADVLLAPSRAWVAELRSAELRSATRFAGLGAVAAYIFDATGRLARQQRRLNGPRALILIAKGVEVTCEDGTPVPIAEELPPRAGAWQGWQLLSVDVADINAIRLISRDSLVDSPDVTLPVSRPLPRPSLVSEPIVGVSGPHGSPVYREPPCVAEPDGGPTSAWRVRWRGDDDTSPAPTSFLHHFPLGPSGRDLSRSLPTSLAFCGTVEIVGPLGSDLRERISVVRGLRVQLPDQVVGPNETLEVPVGADCPMVYSDGSIITDSTLTFAAAQDQVQLAADDMTVTVAIPRMAWAVRRSDGPLPVLGGDLKRIGLDEIESGRAESLIVRCGRPAAVTLVLRGQADEQYAVRCHAEGADGRWAFPLSEFRTTVAASGLARMVLVLRAGDTSAEAAVIEAAHEVTHLDVNTDVDIKSGEAVVEVQWIENRSFVGRQLMLWSKYRLWEPPISHDIPDDVAGRFDCLIKAPPGQYLVHIALRDDWTDPQRPAERQIGVSRVRIGSVADEHARLAKLEITDALEALELVISGKASPAMLDRRRVIAVRDELQRAVAVACEDPTSSGAFDALVELALTADDLLADILADSLGWSLPEPSLVRLGIRLAPAIVDRRVPVRSETLERLWGVVPVVAAAFDYSLDDDSKSRWESFTGWVPRPAAKHLEQPSQPVSSPLDRWDPQALQLLADALPPMGSLPLQFGGYVDAALEMLQLTWPNRSQIIGWRSAHNRITTYTQRLGDAERRQIESLQPDPAVAGWKKFPSDILSAAFQITDEFNRTAATRALLEAAEFAPLLTTRSLLIAIALRVADTGGEPNHA